MWDLAGVRYPSIAFNASPRSLRETDFASRMVDEIKAAGVGACMLAVEITEAALLKSAITCWIT